MSAKTFTTKRFRQSLTEAEDFIWESSKDAVSREGIPKSLKGSGVRLKAIASSKQLLEGDYDFAI